MESAASLKLAEKPAAETARRTVSVAAAVANPVEQIMLSDELSPEQKKTEFAKFVTFPGTKEESRTRIREYQEFEEKMQAVREAIAQQIIQLTEEITTWTDGVPTELRRYGGHFNVFVQSKLSSRGMAFWFEGWNEFDAPRS